MRNKKEVKAKQILSTIFSVVIICVVVYFTWDDIFVAGSIKYLTPIRIIISALVGFALAYICGIYIVYLQRKKDLYPTDISENEENFTLVRQDVMKARYKKKK